MRANVINMHPRLIGGYRVLEDLGPGPHGSVLGAEDTRTGQRVALNLFSFPETLSTSELAAAIEDVRSHARLAARVTHPGFARVLDVAEGDENFFVASERVAGQPFVELANSEALLPVEEAVGLCAEVADALQAGHDVGISHGNLHPANLLRDDTGGVRVLDLGLDVRSGSADPGRSFRSDPGYMSPERIRGQALDGRSDQFSLACVLFELLSGHRPYPGDSVSSVVYRIVNEEPAAFRGDRVPEAVNRVVRRALRREPGARFTSMAEFASALRRAVAIDAGSHPEMSPAEASPPRPPAHPVAPVEPAVGSSRASGRTRSATGRRAAAPVAPSSAPPSSSPSPPATATPTARRAQRRRGKLWIVVSLLALAAIAIAAAFYLDRLPGAESVTPIPVGVMAEATVRVEPAGTEVLLDGIPVPPDGRVRFAPGGPFGILTASRGCRTVERTLAASDDGTEIRLVLEPVRLEVRLDPKIPDAKVTLDDETLGAAPIDLDLDLCRDHRIEIRADGYRDASLEIASGATPRTVRDAVDGLRVEKIPMGTLTLPRGSMDLVFRLDGKRLGKDERKLELLEGEYELRYSNAYFWIEGRQTVRVAAAKTVTPQLDLPPLTPLVVQAFPANCKVELRRRGAGRWTSLGDTPFERKIAPGQYDVRVTLTPTGERKEVAVDLKPGQNPPVRVAFGGGGS